MSLVIFAAKLYAALFIVGTVLSIIVFAVCLYAIIRYGK